MIRRYTQHSANERTYLAWIRTSITIMAFGFLIEKFEIFKSYSGRAMGDETHLHSSLSAELIGLSLFMVGILVIIAATVRFFMHKTAIESEEDVPYNVKRTNILLSLLMVFMAIFLVLYMWQQIMAK